MSQHGGITKVDISNGAGYAMLSLPKGQSLNGLMITASVGKVSPGRKYSNISNYYPIIIKPGEDRMFDLFKIPKRKVPTQENTFTVKVTAFQPTVKRERLTVHWLAQPFKVAFK